MIQHATKTDASPTLRTLCMAAGLVLAPLLAINAQTLRLANPMRPKTSPVTAALKTAARINTTPRH